MAVLQETSLSRPWHWGIVIITDERGDVPVVRRDAPASPGPEGVVLRVRHAQDVVIPDDASDDDIFEASATVHLRTHDAPFLPDRPTICDVTFATKSRRLAVGDADGETFMQWDAPRVRLIASANEAGRVDQDEIWVDLVPASGRSLLGRLRKLAALGVGGGRSHE